MKTSISIAILLSIFLLISIGSSQPMNSSIGSVTMQITGNPGTNHHKETDVDVTKSFIATDSELKFKYDIKTPPVNDFDFVLALDSSGSMVTSRDSEQSNAVAIAVPDFIEKSSIKYKNIKHINMSIISWNDKIDFAYSSPSGFDNKDPSKAYPVGIKDVQKDLTNRHIF
jgi:hypothetical protein